jgi:uncharacterized protein DUF6415
MSFGVLEPAVAAVAVHGGGKLGAFTTDGRTTARVLAGLRRGFLVGTAATPVIDGVFDDLEAVLGEDAAPTAAEIAELARRLHAVYRRLVHLSRWPNSGVSKATVAASWGLMTERMPPGFPSALGYVRRLAMAVSDLLDEVLEDMP